MLYSFKVLSLSLSLSLSLNITKQSKQTGDLEEDTTFFELPVLKNGGRLLRNARTYGLTSQNHLLEVRRVECVKNMKASWFVDDNVVGDDSVYVLTKMDPNYLLLSVLEACSGNRFMELYQTFGEVGFGWMKLLKCSGLDASLICDVNDVCGPDQLFYRLSETKTTEWLKSKCENVAKKLMSTSILSKDKEETQFADGFVTLDSDVQKSSSSSDDVNGEKKRRKYLVTALEVNNSVTRISSNHVTY